MDGLGGVVELEMQVVHREDSGEEEDSGSEAEVDEVNEQDQATDGAM